MLDEARQHLRDLVHPSLPTLPRIGDLTPPDMQQRWQQLAARVDSAVDHDRTVAQMQTGPEGRDARRRAEHDVLEPAGGTAAPLSAAGAAAPSSNRLGALGSADHALMARLREHLPADMHDAHVARIALLARQAHIGDAQEIAKVAVAGDRVFVGGTAATGFARVAYDAAGPEPSVSETVAQLQTLAAQREVGTQQRGHAMDAGLTHRGI